MPGGPGLLSEETEFPAVRDPGPAGRRVAQALQRVGYDELNLRGGPRTVRPRTRPQYFGTLQGARHLGSPEGLSHSLQVGRVSPNNLLTDRFSI